VTRARTPAPSFLAVTPDGGTLFAAGETAPGSVTRFAVGPGGELRERERVASGGSGGPAGTDPGGAVPRVRGRRLTP